jgi:hypothetical protein
MERCSLSPSLSSLLTDLFLTILGGEREREKGVVGKVFGQGLNYRAAQTFFGGIPLPLDLSPTSRASPYTQIRR